MSIEKSPPIKFAVRGRVFDEAQQEAYRIAEEFFGDGWTHIEFEWEPGETRIERAQTLEGETVHLMVGPFEFDVAAVAVRES